MTDSGQTGLDSRFGGRLKARAAMLFGLGSLALICLAWMPFALLLKPLLPHRWGEWAGRGFIAQGFRGYLGLLELTCGCRFDLAEIDRLRGMAPCIVAANHPSLLDAVLLTSRLPNAVCVMKAALMDNILFGAATRLARYIRNDAALRMIIDARAALAGGAHLILFPEGTRTAVFPIDACQLTVGLIAKRAGVPVQTVLIEYSTPYLGKAWPLFRPPVLPLRCRVRLGRCFPPPVDVPAFTAELEAYFREELAATSSPAPAA